MGKTSEMRLAGALCFPQHDTWDAGGSTDARFAPCDQVLIGAISGPTPKIVVIRLRL
jgi:hypothetical protein